MKLRNSFYLKFAYSFLGTLLGILLTFLWIYFLNIKSMGKFYQESPWIIIGVLGGLAGLYFTYRQIRTQKEISQADFLLKIFNQFESETYRRIRKMFCAGLMRNEYKFTSYLYEKSSIDKVYGLFEFISLLWQRKIINLQEINVVFGEYLEAYYEMGEKYGFFKEKGGIFLQEFRKLAKEIPEKDLVYKDDIKELKGFIQAEADMEVSGEKEI